MDIFYYKNAINNFLYIISKFLRFYYIKLIIY